MKKDKELKKFKLLKKIHRPEILIKHQFNTISKIFLVNLKILLINVKHSLKHYLKVLKNASFAQTQFIKEVLFGIVFNVVSLFILDALKDGLTN
jgi:hypothetical protein